MDTLTKTKVSTRTMAMAAVGAVGLVAAAAFGLSGGRLKTVDLDRNSNINAVQAGDSINQNGNTNTANTGGTTGGTSGYGDGYSTSTPTSTPSTSGGYTPPTTPTVICGNGYTEITETCDSGSSNGQPGRCNTTCNGWTATSTPI